MKHPRPNGYKDSGVEAIGHIPAHWDAVPLRRLGRLLKGAGGSKEDVAADGVPCVRYGDLYTTHGETIAAARTCIAIDRVSAYTPIQHGDLLFAASGETLEEIGKSAVNLIPTNACCGGDIIILRPSVPVVPAYLGYAADASPSVAQKMSMGRGTTVKHIYSDELRKLAIAVPPLDEQRAIANFLHKKTAAIDGLIAQKQRLIDLLHEKRTALINRAVTKGLAPNVPMKDSGIPWIGEIPAHWKVLPLRRLVVGIEQGWSPVAEDRPAEGDEWGILKLNSVKQGHFHPQQHKTLPASEQPIPRYEVRDGDLLLTRANTPEMVGDCCVAVGCPPRLMLSDLIYRVMCGPAVHSQFLSFQLLSRFGRSQIEADARGSSQSMVKISQEHIWSWLVIAPPVSEQIVIVESLEQDLRACDEGIVTSDASVTRLQEYRQALITAAVTGKLNIPAHEDTKES